MTKIFSYSFPLASFPLTPPVPPAPAEQLHEYGYNEFLIDLPGHWRQVQSSTHNTITFRSDAHAATLIISVDSYEIPRGKAQAVAEQCVASRLGALEQAAPGRVDVLRQSIRPHSGGVGIELSFVAETPKEVYIYLGHVTSRKVLNLSLVGKPGMQAAAALFDKTIANYRPKFP